MIEILFWDALAIACAVAALSFAAIMVKVAWSAITE